MNVQNELQTCLQMLKDSFIGVGGIKREKEGDLTQSYDKTPYTNRKFENQKTTHKRHQKLRLLLIANIASKTVHNSFKGRVSKEVLGLKHIPSIFDMVPHIVRIQFLVALRGLN